MIGRLHQSLVQRAGALALLAAAFVQPSSATAGELAPEPPFVAKLPNSAAWSIEVQHKKPRGALPTDPGLAATTTRLRDIYPLSVRETVEKVGNDWHREKLYDNQRKDTQWVSNGMIAFQFQNFRPDKVTVVPEKDTLSPAKTGFGPDFPELAWIAANYYEGTVTYAGQSCYLYRNPKAQAMAGGDELLPTSEPNEMTAWISVQTRLPVAVEDANLIRKYTFRPGPASIQPTGIFAEALAKAQKSAKTDGPPPQR